MTTSLQQVNQWCNTLSHITSHTTMTLTLDLMLDGPYAGCQPVLRTSGSPEFYERKSSDTKTLACVGSVTHSVPDAEYAC